MNLLNRKWEKVSSEKHKNMHLIPFCILLLIANDSAFLQFFSYKSQLIAAWSVQNT